MLRSLKDLFGYTVQARDGGIGKVVDFFIDDECWVSRHLVVATGGYLHGRDVLISPLAFGQVDWATRQFHLNLTQDKVRHSPGLDADQPVSRQLELEHYRYYGFPNYWGSSGIWSVSLTQDPSVPEQAPAGGPSAEDGHLRSAKEIRGYHTYGTDDRIGHVDDFIVDDETWKVRYLVVDTGHWWSGKKVLISPHWATEICWELKSIHLKLTRKEIQDSPEWDACSPVNRNYEERLYDYYGRPVYWKTDAANANQPPVSIP